MNEQSKATKRRYNIGNFHTTYFTGKGIDIGAGNDSFSIYSKFFNKIESVDSWDKENGDAGLMIGVNDNTYDFIHSSHCLEHMVDVQLALFNWIRIVKPGGYLIITIPDEKMYEHLTWPSKFNSDHKWSFTLDEPKLSKSINVLELCLGFRNFINIEKIEKIRDFWYETDHDLTMNTMAECAIELILHKK